MTHDDLVKLTLRAPTLNILARTGFGEQYVSG